MRTLQLHRETLSRLTPSDLSAIQGGVVAVKSGSCASLDVPCPTMNAQCPTSGFPGCPADTHHASITGTIG